ncbi:hypothetical protein [Curtobacterium flaccumfaciens]|uniref:hypothetical protein n=1 Tax=Curtobacterium flaccumfaciens TaxID=2035 RepID=UPI00188C1A2A|nr:hypothetical protein [Curtobacterium flaccumfaciens]MBF4629297.1 hypothetical protein [Curtobacterium flaccumfaciens]
MNNKSTYTFRFEHQKSHATAPLPPKGPWGVTWLIVRVAGVLVGSAHVVVPLLQQ